MKYIIVYPGDGDWNPDLYFPADSHSPLMSRMQGTSNINRAQRFDSRAKAARMARGGPKAFKIIEVVK